MPGRYFNWKLVIVLLIGFVVLGSTAFGLRKWQRSRRAEQGLVLGNKAYDEHRWEEAVNQLGRYLGVMQDDVPALLKYAESQLNIRPLKQSNVQQAIAAYRNVLRLDPGNLKAAKPLSEMYLSMGMSGEAELVVTRALQAGESIELRKVLAIALANQRKFTEAAKELESIIEKNPEQASAYEVLGRLVEQRPEDFTEDPNFWFDQAVKTNPFSAEAYIARGAYFLRQGNKNGAMADLEQAEQKDLSDPTTRLRLAEGLINVDASDRAKKQLEIVHTSEPNNQLLWQLWAQLALKSDSNDMMLKVADTGLKELSSQPWDFMPDAAELFIRCGQLERAEECIAMMRQKDVAPATTAFLEGLLAESQGRDYEAVKYWRQAIQLGAKSARTRILLANALWRLGDRQSGINQLRTLVSEQPNLFSGRMTLARMLAETGRWADVAEQTRMARQISPHSGDAVLLDIQARMQVLADSKTDKESSSYRDIEATLGNLDKVTNGAPEVKLLQFRLALQRDNLPEAEKLIAYLKKAHPAELKVTLAEADLLVAQNKTDDAIAKLREVIGTSPQSTAVLSRLVVLLAAKGDHQECETLIKNVLASAGQPSAKREMALLLSDVYSRWNEGGKRYSLLNSLAEELQDDILVKRELLTCEEVLKDNSRAQHIVDTIKSIEGDDGWQWRYEQAKIWFAQEDFKNRYPQIVSLLQENLLANPDDQASRMLLAAAYEKGNDQRLAISAYTEALNRSPKDIRIIVPAVAALYRAGEYTRAEEILKRATEEKLYHPELERLEIQGALGRGDLGSANYVLEKMLVRDPNNRSVCLSLALLKIRQDKFTEADKLMEKLRTEEPNSLPIAAAQVELDIRRGKSGDALHICDEMVNKLHTASAILFRGRTYAALKQADKAREDFERAVTMEPNNADAWVAKSIFHHSLGESDKAISDIRHALSVIPDNPQIQKTAVSLYLASDNNALRQEGESILQKAMDSNPEDAELRLQKAKMLLAKGTAPGIEEATGILQSITEQQPDIGDAWVLLAQIALQDGKPAKAIDIALRGLVRRPNDRTLLLLKARGEAARSPALALPTMRALWELDPNNADAIISLAETYVAAGEYDNAVNFLRKQPVFADVLQQRRIKLALAVALYKNGYKTESEEILRVLHESEPNDPSPLLAQIRLLRDDKLWGQLREKVTALCEEHFNEIETTVFIADELAGVKDGEGKQIAEELLRCVLKRDTNSAVVMTRLGMLLQTSGRSAEAAKLYERVLERQADNLIVINNLAWILCEEQGHPKEAIDLAERGLAKAPDYVDLIDTRGMAYYRLKQYDKAMQDFNKCIRLYPSRALAIVTSYFHLGRCLADLGEKTQAIEQLNKALELNKELGGLGSADIAEAHRLLVQLSGGGN
jgi:tetratricopeptide (TPR) repeat protein